MSSRRLDPLASISTRVTPQAESADARQVKNSTGGYVFQLEPLAQLRRFLTLGVAGGTYYASDRQLARENAQVVIDLVKTRGDDVVREIVDVSRSGRAPRNDPALFALALAISLGDVATRRLAGEALAKVARTGTHLMQFNTYVKQFRGRGRILDRAIENWYLQRDVKQLAYQVVKYRQREGWTHRDLLRLAKPKARDDDYLRRALFDWITHRDQLEFTGGNGVYARFGDDDELRLVAGFEAAQRTTEARLWAEQVREYRLPWEALPTHALNKAAVWEALLDVGVPQTALMRQLPRLTNLGLLPNVGGRTNEVTHQLSDVDRLQRARVHPVNVLVAQRTYARGHSERGSTTWTPSRRIVDALDTAFYAAYGAVRATGQRIMLALDVSSSMGWNAAGELPITARDASAALALVTASVETEYEIVGFTSGGIQGTGLTSLSISPHQRLDDVIKSVSSLPFGGTDCALPMLHALDARREFDAFMIYTDNETWAGQVHPHQALTRYRDRTGINAALGVIGMTSTDFTIGDPSDPRTLNVVGFDSATPNLLADFIAGDV